MSGYTFNTRVVFLLGKFLKHFESNLDEILELVSKNGGYKPGDDIFANVGAEQFLKMLFQVIGSTAEAEHTAIELLAVSSRRSQEEVRQMDGYEFIKELREMLTGIDWTRLMGESLGLGLGQALVTPTAGQLGPTKRRQRQS